MSSTLDGSLNDAARKMGGVRFAPSPTGRFHIGNLRTAWISHQWAKKLGVPWVVRFEDIDKPRVVASAQVNQLSDLADLGMKPELVLQQSTFIVRHWQLFIVGIRTGQVYPCDCSRKEVQTALAELASAPNDGQNPLYSGHCRGLASRTLQSTESIAWRFKMPDESGKQDIIIARTGPTLNADGLPSIDAFVPAYHWACAIDDYEGEYDLLVRSWDLESAAEIQRTIQLWLATIEGFFPTLTGIFHTSLITQNDGHRLEKRTQGVTLPELTQAGINSAALIKAFEDSFDSELLNIPMTAGLLIGEKQRTMTLSELKIGL